MDIGEKVLGALGQAQDSFQVNDLRTGLSGITEAARQQLQVAQFLQYLFGGISLIAHTHWCYFCKISKNLRIDNVYPLKKRDGAARCPISYIS
jgi:hypothetical protein